MVWKNDVTGRRGAEKSEKSVSLTMKNTDIICDNACWCKQLCQKLFSHLCLNVIQISGGKNWEPDITGARNKLDYQ